MGDEVHEHNPQITLTGVASFSSDLQFVLFFKQIFQYQVQVFFHYRLKTDFCAKAQICERFN